MLLQDGKTLAEGFFFAKCDNFSNYKTKNFIKQT